MTSIVNFLLCLLVSVHFAKCDLESLFEKCCTLGKNTTLDSQKCESKISTPIQGVPVEHQDICLQVADLCCVQHLREKACTDGELAAKQNATCSIGSNTDEDIIFKYCCESCKQGMIRKSMSMDCKVKNLVYPNPWQEVYKTCCEEHIPNTTTINTLNTTKINAPNITTINTPNTTTTNNQTQEQVHTCELHAREVCSQICVPVGDSYRCQCMQGFVLMDDGKSCIPDNLAKSLECQKLKCNQRCLFDGERVKCSCNPGFQSSADNRTCDDINECILKIDNCNTTGRTCINIEGGYKCVRDSVIMSAHEKTINLTTNCPSGYRYNTIEKKCLDIDECNETNPCNKTSETCSNTAGSYHCNLKVSCPNGYLFDDQTTNCTQKKTMNVFFWFNLDFKTMFSFF